MRILFLSSRLPYAGVASGHTIVHQRIKRLVERGHEVGLAAFHSDGHERDVSDLKDMLLELELLPPPKPKFTARSMVMLSCLRIPRRFQHAYSPAMKRLVGDMVERSRYDVVVAEFTGMGQHLYHNPFLPAVRRVVSCHRSATMISHMELGFSEPSLNAFRESMGIHNQSRFEFSLYANADRVLVLTPQDRYWLLNHMPNLRLSVVPSGVDDVYFQPHSTVASEPAIIFTGYYSDEPNADAVLWFLRTTWPLLEQRHPNLTFYVVGPEPPAAIQDVGKKNPRIIVTGMVDDIRPYLSRAQVFVCPMRTGAGLKTKVIEAMACALPVVSTTVGMEGIPAQVGQNCFLADRPDIMAQYISLLLEDSQLRRSIACNARNMVVERFSWESSVSRLENVLEEVMGR